jgi:hypothetical protein
MSQELPPATGAGGEAYGTFNASTSSLDVNAIPPSHQTHHQKKQIAKNKGKPRPPTPQSQVTVDDWHIDEEHDEHEPLVRPSELTRAGKTSFFGRISGDLVPFMSFVGWMFRWKKKDILPVTVRWIHPTMRALY